MGRNENQRKTLWIGGRRIDAVEAFDGLYVHLDPQRMRACRGKVSRKEWARRHNVTPAWLAKVESKSKQGYVLFRKAKSYLSSIGMKIEDVLISSRMGKRGRVMYVNDDNELRFLDDIVPELSPHPRYLKAIIITSDRSDADDIDADVQLRFAFEAYAGLAYRTRKLRRELVNRKRGPHDIFRIALELSVGAEFAILAPSEELGPIGFYPESFGSIERCTAKFIGHDVNLHPSDENTAGAIISEAKHILETAKQLRQEENPWTAQRNAKTDACREYDYTLFLLHRVSRLNKNNVTHMGILLSYGVVLAARRVGGIFDRSSRFSLDHLWELDHNAADTAALAEKHWGNQGKEEDQEIWTALMRVREAQTQKRSGDDETSEAE